MFFKEYFQPQDLEEIKQIQANRQHTIEEIGRLSKSLNHSKEAFQQVFESQMGSLARSQALFFINDLMREYENSIQAHQSNPYLGLAGGVGRAKFGDDINDIYWNPFGKCW